MPRRPPVYLKAFLIAGGLGILIVLILTEGYPFVKSFATIADHITDINKHYAQIVSSVFHILGMAITFGIAVIIFISGLRVKSSSRNTWLAQDIFEILILVLKALRILIVLFIIQELIFMLISGEVPEFALRPIASRSVLASGMAILLDLALLAFFSFLLRQLRLIYPNIVNSYRE